MSFKPVSTTATDIKKHQGKSFVGEFKGSQKITTKIGEQTIWNFTDDSGAPLNVYGFTNLNRVMEHIEVGTVCRLTYKGTENVQTKFGMKDVHQVLVEIDDEGKTEKEEEFVAPVNGSDLPF
jgi:hypothetical protein